MGTSQSINLDAWRYSGSVTDVLLDEQVKVLHKFTIGNSRRHAKGRMDRNYRLDLDLAFCVVIIISFLDYKSEFGLPSELQVLKTSSVFPVDAKYQGILLSRLFPLPQSPEVEHIQGANK